MIQAQISQKSMTFDQFIACHPDGSKRYELIDGKVHLMELSGDHSEATGFIAAELNLEIRRLKLSYFIPGNHLVKPIDSQLNAYRPDVLVLDKPALKNEPQWQSQAMITRGHSVKLAVEVVSTPWHDDYLTKLRDYESMGIPEYWIVDYLALGATRYTGSPKQPTISIYRLLDGEYQVEQFRGNDRLVSPTFPELELTAEQIFIAGSLANP